MEEVIIWLQDLPMKKDNIKLLDDFIQKDFIKKNFL